jgi:feruloyl-CoA synthase
MIAGVPYTAVSVAYSSLSSDFGRLKHVLNVLDPGLVFAEHAVLFGRALSLPEMKERIIVVGSAGEVEKGAIPFADLLAASPIENAPQRASPRRTA